MILTRFAAAFAFCTAAAWAQAPTIAGVLNIGDFSTHLSPGLNASVFGTNFGSGPASSVTVTVGGKPAFVLNVTQNQLNVELPLEAAVGASTVTVTVNGASSAPFPITLDAYSPAFAVTGTGAGLIRTQADGKDVTTTAPARPGDKLSAYGFGLGPTTPSTPTGIAAAGANPTTTKATLTVGGVPADVSYSGSAPGLIGLYQINFTVPAGVQGTQDVVLTIGGKSSSPVKLALFGVTAVVSNASFVPAGPAAPGSIVSVFANGLGTTDQTVGFPNTKFQNISVLFNGTAAPLFHLIGTQGQIDLLVPYELPESGTVNVQLATPTGTSLSYSLKMAPAAPGIYFIPDPSTKDRFNVTAQFNNTAWLAMPAGMATALKLPGSCTTSNANPLALCGQPAAPGDYLVLYATGLGKATPNGDPNAATLKTGDIPPADGSVLYKTVLAPTVTVGGLPATVVFAGLAPGFPGEYQIDFQVPAGITGDDIPVVVTVGSASDTRTISIQPR